MREFRPLGGNDVAQRIAAGVAPLVRVRHRADAHTVEYNNKDAFESGFHRITSAFYFTFRPSVIQCV
jgi:hypothetical protein